METVQSAAARLRALPAQFVDGLLVVALAIPPVLVSTQLHSVVGALASLALTLPMFYRRRYPLLVYIIQLGALAVSAQTLHAFAGTVTSVIALLEGARATGVYSRHRLLSFLVVTAPALVGAVGMTTGPAHEAPWTLLIIVPWLFGNSMRSQVALLEQRASSLEREQLAVARAAAGEERARIARELHDVVAHNVSVMVIQAGAARKTIERDPGKAVAALHAVEDSGREALSELRRMLGLLSEERDGGALDPQPGLGQLNALAERMSSAGLPVEVRFEGAPRPLPAGLELTAYRIVQEALTNTLKHAGGATTAVVVRFADEALNLEVLDSGGTGAAYVDPSGGAGRGLVGMQERVAVYGGQLDAGRRPGGGFAVRACLPLPAR